MTEDNLFVQEPEEKKQINFATVSEIYEDGISLLFDGEDTPSEKHYKCNSFILFAKGDRVRIVEDSGTYIVEYPVGNPRTTFEVDYAKKAGQAENATRADAATRATTATRATNADEATNATRLNNKTESNLSVNTAKYFTDRHSGSRLGFFNSSGGRKDAVSNVSTSASTSTIAQKLNELLAALRSYGLIN